MPHPKLTTELDADPIKLFLGAIYLMNPQNLVRAVADPALVVQTWRLEGIVFCPLLSTKRTSRPRL